MLNIMNGLDLGPQHLQEEVQLLWEIIVEESIEQWLISSGGLELKNERGFSLLEIIITISLTGIVLTAMSRTIKTGLNIHSFLRDKNSAVCWTESVLSAFKNKSSDIADNGQKAAEDIVQQLEILEAESLPKNYDMTKVEVVPYEDDGIIYSGLYQVMIEVNYSCKDRKKSHELIALLKK